MLSLVQTQIQIPDDINASMRCMHAMRPIYLSDTVLFGINHINKFEYAGKKRHRISQARISTENTLCSSNEVLQY